MGRAYVPAELSSGRPSGPKWSAYARMLKARWWQAGRRCYYCSHRFLGPDYMEAAHLISPLVAPAKGWSPDNLVPAHGSTKRVDRRCPEPDCQLNCNWAAHNSPLCHSNKNPDGEDLPFTPEILALLQADRRQFLAAKRAIPRDSGGNPGQAPRKLVIPFRADAGDAAANRRVTEPGRPWLTLCSNDGQY